MASYSEPRFKLGDRVKVISTENCFNNDSIGKIGIITELENKNYATVSFEGGGEDWGRLTEIELIETPMFKIGDRVEILNNHSGHCYEIGHVGEITEIGDESDNARVGPNDVGNWVTLDNLKLVEPPISSKTLRDLINDADVFLRDRDLLIPKHPMMKLTPDDLTFHSEFKVSSNRRGVLDMLRSIPARIKRVLDKRTKAMYRLEWIDSDLGLSTRGRGQLDQLLHDTYAEKLGDLAIKEVARLKAEAKK